MREKKSSWDRVTWSKVVTIENNLGKFSVRKKKKAAVIGSQGAKLQTLKTRLRVQGVACLKSLCGVVKISSFSFMLLKNVLYTFLTSDHVMWGNKNYSFRFLKLHNQNACACRNMSFRKISLLRNRFRLSQSHCHLENSTEISM